MVKMVNQSMIDFIDQGNGKWDEGEDYTDLGNKKWDSAEPFTDENDNGKWDETEPFTDENDNGKWDTSEAFIDIGNGIYDEGEEFSDGFMENMTKGICCLIETAMVIMNPAEPFTDENDNGKWDETEPITDENDNGKWDKGEMTLLIELEIFL